LFFLYRLFRLPLPLLLPLFLPLPVALPVLVPVVLLPALSLPLPRVVPPIPIPVPVLLRALLLWWVFGLILAVYQFLHGLHVLRIEVLADLFDDIVERSVDAVLLALLLVHMLHELDQGVLDLPAGVGEDHHDEVLHQRLTSVEPLGGVVVHDRRVVELAETAEVHRHLVVQPHQLRRLVEVLEVLVVVEHLDEPLDQLAVGVHGVLVEAVVKVVGELLVLRLAVGGVGEVVLVEGVLEDVLGLDDVDRSSSH
jgi:hypothetical protein